MRTKEECEKIVEMYEIGISKSKISKELNIAKTTVSAIIDNKQIENGVIFPKKDPEKRKLKLEQNYSNFTIEQQKAYSYILGIYLGDGHIVKYPDTWKLSIFCDYKYPKIIEEICNSLSKIFPFNKVSPLVRKKSCVEIYVYSNNVLNYFPQHGVGKKSQRKIFLLPWQENILNMFRTQFLRGLFHSDGCRYLHPKAGIRYSFVNTSVDIINLFENYLNKENIAYKTREVPPSKCYPNASPAQVVDIYRREETKKLDTFLGAKM